MNANEPQPKPIPNARPAIWDLVIQDMRERNRVGTLKYGTPLQAHNGRDALVDAYQEALDLAVYLRQAIEERNPERDPRESPFRWTVEREHDWELTLGVDGCGLFTCRACGLLKLVWLSGEFFFANVPRGPCTSPYKAEKHETTTPA